MVNILFVHPDLGIGGAERLTVDAAIALQNKGHRVHFLTNHHDPQHCFEETRNGTINVQVIGDWLPRHIFGKCFALCAYIRMLYAALYIACILSRKEKLDVIFCDLISIGIPIFKLAKHKPKILFYCHFPDQLLSHTDGSKLKETYRMPLNYLEEQTTGQADMILVNSHFTQTIFRQTFHTLKQLTPQILYPSLNTKYFDEVIINEETEVQHSIPSESIVFLSINRFERKKNINLAIKAFKSLQTRLHNNNNIDGPTWQNIRLIIAGGYDDRIAENVSYLIELKSLACQLNVERNILFIKSPSDKYKVWLIKRCRALIYTPHEEHFGIVPVEAMYCGKPVIAVNSGGPMETVKHNITGYLCEPNNADEFANRMHKFCTDQIQANEMGQMGLAHVKRNFSFQTFANKLNGIIEDLIK